MSATTALIIGIGHVGKALYRELHDLGRTVYYETLDAKGLIDTDLPAKINPDIVFYCLPTSTPSGMFSDILVCTSVKQGLTDFPNSLHVVHSTISTNFAKRIGPEPNVVYMPEFRSERELSTQVKTRSLVIGLPIDPITKEYVDESAYDTLTLFLGYNNTDYFPSVVRTNFSTAVVGKLVNNAVLAMRVAMTNEIYAFSKHLGADPSEVLNIVGSDPRIGSEYLNPSLGFGGPCLPKDTHALLSKINDQGHHSPLFFSIVESNLTHIQRIVRAIARTGAKTVGFNGVAFAPNAQSTVNSMAVNVMSRLAQMGVKVYYYDKLNIDSIASVGTRLQSEQELKTTCEIVIEQDTMTYVKEGILYELSHLMSEHT